MKPIVIISKYFHGTAQSGLVRGTILAILGLAALLLGGGALYWTIQGKGRGAARVDAGSGFRQAPEFRLKEIWARSRPF